MDEQLFKDLLQGIREMKAYERGEEVPGVRVTRIEQPDPARVRSELDLSQSEFAALLGISLRTLQNWEQGHRRPSGPALQLLRVVAKHPDAVLDAVRNV
jgi:putative transcriptional regulator